MEPTVPATAVVVLVIDKLADGTTVSVSDASQMPDVHETEGLLLVTAAGGLMRAVLTTWVCADTSCGEKIPSNSVARDTAKSRIPQLPSFRKNSFARVPKEIKCNTLCEKRKPTPSPDALVPYTCSLVRVQLVVTRYFQYLARK